MAEQIFAAYPLAGAYRGKSVTDRVLRSHAVSNLEQTVIGRAKRGYGKAFCNPKLDLSDEGSWEPASHVTCPACIDILARLASK